MEKKTLYKRVMQLLRPYRFRILSMGGIMGVITIGNIFIPLLQQKLVDDGLIKNSMGVLAELALVITGISIAVKFGEFLQSKLQMKLHLDFIKNMELEVLDHSLRLDSKYIQDNGLFKIVKDTGYFVNSIAKITGNEVSSAILQACKFLGILIGLLMINWKLTLFVLITIPVRVKISNKVSTSIGRFSEESIETQQNLHSWEDDIFSAANEVKLWNLYDEKKKEYKGLLSKRNKVIEKLNMNVVLSMISGEAFQSIVINGLYIICGLLMWREGLTVGGVMAFIAYAGSLMEPVALFSHIRIILAEIEPALQKYDEFYQLKCEETRDEYQHRVAVPEKSQIELKFTDIGFSFGERTLFTKGSFQIKSGEKVALIGENGSGKSTLINMLLRFYRPGSGQIFLNGVDVSGIRLQEYRELFSVVSQKPYLFQGSILDNLTLFGKNSIDNTVYKEELLSFIENLPEKENTDIGNDSSHLSGGEKQKIALYRALMKKSKILIMDEPTANYDVKSEQEFVNVVLDNKKDITIVITHDPRLLRHVDKILLVKNQQIYCYYNYNELCQQEPQYKIGA